jgi:hypothetical protein
MRFLSLKIGAAAIIHVSDASMLIAEFGATKLVVLLVIEYMTAPVWIYRRVPDPRSCQI